MGCLCSEELKKASASPGLGARVIKCSSRLISLAALPILKGSVCLPLWVSSDWQEGVSLSQR